ncbi:hypothetical protein ACXO6E_09350, partial [Lactobacillus delbrueckii subsp. bulgaricus]
RETMAPSILGESMRTSSTSSGFWQESWKRMARLDCREALKKLSKSENQASEALRACSPHAG